MSFTRSLIYHEDGQALPEFALVVPLLMVALMAVISFGKAFNYWNDATHISAEGARYAVVNSKPHPANATSLQTQLQLQSDTKELREGGRDAVPVRSEVCVDFPNGAPAKRGDPVRVTMKFRYHWLPILDIGPSTEIVSTAVMRLETAPTTYSAGCA